MVCPAASLSLVRVSYIYLFYFQIAKKLHPGTKDENLQSLFVPLNIYVTYIPGLNKLWIVI